MKGKKILVIVIIIVAVLAVAGTVFGYLFLKTDLLKSNKELFAKYVNQNFDSFKEISNLKIIDTYKNLKDEDKYESNSELNVSVKVSLLLPALLIYLTETNAGAIPTNCVSTE